jgi:hypothetical protein
VILYPSYVDYAPAELVLNRFDPYGGWLHTFALSPTKKQLVAAGPGKIYWIDDWDNKDRMRIEIQELDVDKEVLAAAYSGDGERVGFFIAKFLTPVLYS